MEEEEEQDVSDCVHTCVRVGAASGVNMVCVCGGGGARVLARMSDWPHVRPGMVGLTLACIVCACVRPQVPEYLKNSRRHKGSNEGLKPFGLAQLVSVAKSGKVR